MRRPSLRRWRGLSLPAPRGAIEFRHVTFRYRPNSLNVLKEASLSIGAGEVIGIVGPSGSGKSTLTKLVQRLYLPNEGQVLIDGADLSQVDPAWLRRHIGVVFRRTCCSTGRFTKTSPSPIPPCRARK